jgi:hypothetical protein
LEAEKTPAKRDAAGVVIDGLLVVVAVPEAGRAARGGVHADPGVHVEGAVQEESPARPGDELDVVIEAQGARLGRD